MDFLPYCEDGSMIPVDLSANCEGRIYDPNGSGIQILGIRSRDPFSGSTDMSGQHHSSERGLSDRYYPRQQKHVYKQSIPFPGTTQQHEASPIPSSHCWLIWSRLVGLWSPSVGGDGRGIPLSN